MHQVREYAYTGAVAGFWVAAFVDVVSEVGSRNFCSEAASQFPEELFAQKLSACYRGLRIGQFIIVPATTILAGSVVGVLASLTGQVARNLFRRVN